ncbi:alkyl hydroperoxide reductase subunit F [Psittacicella gerlachiana]|uniref:Alkyl hydroperoxide reductase subunit F n=1 Tax=Psittacicella gerlachiana TaxID=2028574 RepID=A0A3A1YE35_9GAMM|nr:alkyl hydroperoxide reductase subunit F [Psittacicella gerlachiana]RIY34444.1 alkyl hydroperoxide reductase subunit F [Psittacicella gerlachiana]
MLDQGIKSQLQTYLERVELPIELQANLGTDAKSQELKELLQEIASLRSDKITYTEVDTADRKPAFTITRVGSDVAVTFAGIPMGHEFTSLVLALLQVGGYPAKLSDEVVEQIKALPGDYQFETYFSLSCQNCPDVVQALNAMSVINPRIKHVSIDGALFQEEVDRLQIMSVPSVYLNGEQFLQGRSSVEEILAKLDTGASARKAAQLSEKEEFDVLVVGGGPAGAAAAVYAARKGIRTGVVAERFGGQVQDTMDIENFISVLKTEGPHLATALEEHVRSYGVDIMNLQRVSKLIPGEKQVTVELESGATLKSKSVILSTGARWRNMNVPGEAEYKARGVAYCPHCDGPLFKGKDVAVIGGGNSGVEAAIDLAGVVNHVTLIERDEKLRADEVLQNKLRSLPNVKIITNAATTEVHGDGQKVVGLSYQDRATEEVHRLDLAGVFVQIGLVPNTDFLRDTLELNRMGEIITDDRGQTNVKGVFAAGDCTNVPYKQIIIAMGEGAKASLAAFDYLIRNN